MKNKLKFKASIMIILLVLINLGSYYGISPLYKQVKTYRNAQTVLNETAAKLNNYSIKCFNMLSPDLTKLNTLENELSKTDQFCGIYKYPDTEIITSINFGDNFHGYITNDGTVNGNIGFIPYEYNEGLNKINFLEIQEGEMFEFKTYKTTEALPVVVSENAYFTIGDKIKLNLNVSNSNIEKFPNEDDISIDAIVCGIAKKNVYLPGLYQQKFSSTAYFSKINELVWVFTPSLNEYTKLFNYQPSNESSGTVMFYALQEGYDSKSEKIINKYGSYDAIESLNTVGWDLQRETFAFEETHLTSSLVIYLLIYITSIGFFIKNIIIVLYRIRKDIYD